MGNVTDQIRRIVSYKGVDEGAALEHVGRSWKDGAPGVGTGSYEHKSSGDNPYNPYQHRGSFITRVKELKAQGMSEIDVAKAVGLKNTSELRAQYSIAINDERSRNVKSAMAMLEDGKSRKDVCDQFHINESTLRSWLNEKRDARSNAARQTAENLKQLVNEKGMIDVGAGVEAELGISSTKLNQALQILKDEGYPVYYGGVPQATNPGKQTILRVLCQQGVPYKDIYDHDRVQSITDYKLREDSEGNERLEKGFEYPASMDPKRLMIRFKDDVAPDGHTGIEKDGTIEIRRGCPDLDLGKSHYAQVRILVDGDRYLKGMAFYSDDMPPGVDVVFNTNKEPKPMRDVLKPIGNDPSNPFGALLKEEGGQYHYDAPDGSRKLGLINKTREEGDWDAWSDRLPSQFLSKQPMKLIQKQLSLSIADKQAEYESIMALTNPTVKKSLLESFASDCDSTAEHLDAAKLPGQKYQVVLPIATLNDNEVYAPGYNDGDTVALIRYPHGGTFEIPILKVNNKHPDGVRIFGKEVTDMVGVNKNVADRLSGADFDGDTVMVIPCNSDRTNVRIQSTPKLEGLSDFDPKVEYAYTRKEVDAKGVEHYFKDGHEFPRMKKGQQTQLEMGKISNLITDMTLRGATPAELARAVKHSMVVIDAQKHCLDWKQSEIDNGIMALKRLYQEHIRDETGKLTYSANTLISRAKNEVSIEKTQGKPKINESGKPWYDPNKPEGALIYKKADDLYWTDKKGRVHTRTEKSTQMAQTDDAFKLSSGTPQETAYANYANWLKAKANEARKNILTAGSIKYDASANKAYKAEVDDLLSQLAEAKKNSPRERKAQLAADAEVKAMKKNNPDMTKKEIKKKSQQALTKFRLIFGAKRTLIRISERAWQAIQSGAISESRLSEILRYSDKDKIREYATPRQTLALSPGKQARIKAMRSSGYTLADIAEALGVAKSTVVKYVNGEEA